MNMNLSEMFEQEDGLSDFLAIISQRVQIRRVLKRKPLADEHSDTNEIKASSGLRHLTANLGE